MGILSYQVERRRLFRNKCPEHECYVVCKAKMKKGLKSKKEVDEAMQHSISFGAHLPLPTSHSQSCILWTWTCSDDVKIHLLESAVPSIIFAHFCKIQFQLVLLAIVAKESLLCWRIIKLSCQFHLVLELWGTGRFRNRGKRGRGRGAEAMLINETQIVGTNSFIVKRHL